MTTTPAPGLPLTELLIWSRLAAHYQEIKDFHLRTLMAENAERAARFSAEGGGLFFDYSKHRITEKTLGLRICLARESGLQERIDAMFIGERSSRSQSVS
ncbi:MAG: hypothetical protein RQ722_04615 [Desulfuromonadales bacterium]|nr:hypothetical protein [Desulfuromonadales bacterium]